MPGTAGLVAMSPAKVVTNGESDGREDRRATPVKAYVALFKQLMEVARDHSLEKSEFVRVVVVKCGAVYGSGLGDVMYAELVQTLLLEKLAQGALKKLPGAPHTRIANVAV